MDFYNEYAISEARSLDGVWVPFQDGIEFLIARATNERAMGAMRRELKRHERVLKAEDDNAFNRMKEINIRVLAKHVLLDWKGSVKIQGEAIEYSVENAQRLLAFEGFRKWVEDRAADEDNFKAVQDEEDEKN